MQKSKNKKSKIESTNEKSLSTKDAVSIEEQLSQYVKHSNGAIFRVLAHEKKIGKVLLYSKNKHEEYDFLKLRNGLVDGSWKTINEHELRKHIKSEEEYQQQLSFKLVKRILFTQLLMEVDDELTNDFENDKYIRGILEKSEKQFIRLISEQYNKFYQIDKQAVHNFLKHIEGVISKVAKVNIESFYDLDKHIEKFILNPEAYKSEVVEFEKID